GHPRVDATMPPCELERIIAGPGTRPAEEHARAPRHRVEPDEETAAPRLVVHAGARVRAAVVGPCDPAAPAGVERARVSGAKGQACSTRMHSFGDDQLIELSRDTLPGLSEPHPHTILLPIDRRDRRGLRDGRLGLRDDVQKRGTFDAAEPAEPADSIVERIV